MNVEGNSIKSEVSYLNGELVSYGTKGSVRLDVAVYDKAGTLVHVFDVKTGNATLKNSQIEKIHQHTRTKVPVTEIKIE